MTSRQATGLQVAFLMLAVMLISVPITNLIVETAGLFDMPQALVQRGAHFFLAMAIILAFPGLRAFAREALARPIPASMRSEVLAVALAKLAVAFALAGALAAWFWWTQGVERLERVGPDIDREVATAFSAPVLIRFLLAVLVAPVVEELVFRGFIYRAFERQWGWLVAMLATSIIFGLYHTHFWSAFLGAIVFTCLLRRTGSLRAPILAHMLFNLMLWWPLLGQHVFPQVDRGNPMTWFFHFACLAFVVIAVPIYVWMSRDRHVVAPTVFLETNAALSK